MTLLRSIASAALVCAIGFAAEPGMVFVPGGEFARGRTHKLPDDGLQWWPELLTDDRPVRQIRIDPFYIDAYETTVAQYAAFVKATKHRAPYNWAGGAPPKGKEKNPVAAIDWNDAKAYCEWAGKRLPTEAEWERAARGITEGSKYPWGEKNPTKKDACYDTLAGPCDVGQFKPNYFGLYDVAGGVWEWTSDWYEREYYKSAPEVNPKGPEKGLYRVIRGGSWSDVPKYLTLAHRSWLRPLERSPNVGVRCAKSFKPRSPR